jgi:uncharacterized protein involved in type VI secretion and phage assembly
VVCALLIYGRVLVGDAAVGTLRGSPIAVVVAPRGSLSCPGELRRVGVGFHGDEESQQAMRFAADLAAT